MTEYIDRKELTARICEDRRPLGFAMLFEHLRGAPAADVAPVVHGRWVVESSGNNWRCSACGSCFFPGPYCPNCRARMDGGAEDG